VEILVSWTVVTGGKNLHRLESAGENDPEYIIFHYHLNISDFSLYVCTINMS
jgi:hypothetical protein